MVTQVLPPSPTLDPRAPSDEQVARIAVRRIVNRHPAVGLALGVIRDGTLASFHGHGLADIASGRPMGPDTGFRIASITKTFTAIAVMQLHERGLIDLDAPAGDHLRAFRIVPANPAWRRVTVRDLMTHTAGVPETIRPRDALRPDWGESVPSGDLVPSLAEHYRGALRIVAEPGSRFVYGNNGPATLGQIVEDVSGIPLARYLREHIFDPLGMVDTDLVRTDRVRANLATGYELVAGRTKVVAPREFITAGGASVYSTTRDMARYVAALLGGGANEHGRILASATLATMFEPQYRTDPRLAGMGLGFMRLDLAGRVAVDHQGLMPGFNSQMTLVPDAGIGIVAFTNGAREPSLWLPAEVSGLLRQLLDLPPDAIRDDVPQRPDVWSEIVGWYRLDAAPGDVRVRGVVGLGIEVFVRSGALAVRFLGPIPALYRGFPLHPDDPADPYAFRADMSSVGMGTSRVVFSRGPDDRVTAAHVDMMPLSLHRQPAATNPRRWATGTFVGLGVVGGLMALRRARGTRCEASRP